MNLHDTMNLCRILRSIERIGNTKRTAKETTDAMGLVRAIAWSATAKSAVTLEYAANRAERVANAFTEGKEVLDPSY